MGIFILPYFVYKRKFNVWKNPKYPKLLMMNYVLFMVLPLVDVLTDFLVEYDTMQERWTNGLGV